MNQKKLATALLFLCFYGLAFAQLNINAAKELLHRIIPAQTSHFVIEPLKAKNGQDCFQIESRNGKIVLSGNNGVSIASALYYYLNDFCHCQITWNGVNLHLPNPLPNVPNKITKYSPYHYRYYLNYCTFNYSMSWWNWDRWEKEIDWMALHGIDMPLAITGEEYVWYKVYKEMGFSDQELASFFSGPAYFSWFWMGNLDGWGGPLPFSWMKSHAELEQKILQRERNLGMKPVLPAFTGHVPASFAKKYPNAKLKKVSWNGDFADTYILDPEDPMFRQIGKTFLEKQTEIFGTDHLYSADTFNENRPPSNDSAYLAKIGSTVFESMKQVDPKAIWVMQGWLFYSDQQFWQAPQMKALLNAVPDDHMIILDLYAEEQPVWKRTKAFYGKPWIWNMLNNFGGRTSMYGNLETVAKDPAEALHDKSSGKMVGIGLTMEAIEQNPVVYELMLHNTWKSNPIDIDQWLQSYIRNRYGTLNPFAIKAWKVLKNTVYSSHENLQGMAQTGAQSIITGRPTFDSVTVWTQTTLNYRAIDLLPAWDDFIKAIPACQQSDGFQYDIVDVTRQVLANYALTLQKKWVKAYQQKDRTNFEKYSTQFISLIDDMDHLLATRKDFLLGPWLSDAKSWGTNEQEKALYERNARDLITLWGDANSSLHEYSGRQWSGLLSDFYKVRWQKFFTEADAALSSGKEMDMSRFDKAISIWEWQWVNGHKIFPVHPSGNSIQMVKSLYKKYRQVISPI
jgi:alpha-N-acetylglucosaminidase